MFNSNIWPSSFTRYKASKSEWPWLWPFKVTQGQMWWCHWTLHIWFPIDIYSNRMSVSHRLAAIATQNVFSYLLSLGPNNEKLKVHRMTLKATRPKVPHICLTTTHESQISLRFALQSFIFQIIEVFDFSIGCKGEFEIFDKQIIKNWILKIAKIPNVVLWGSLGGKFRTKLKNFGCDL